MRPAYLDRPRGRRVATRSHRPSLGAQPLVADHRAVATGRRLPDPDGRDQRLRGPNLEHRYNGEAPRTGYRAGRFSFVCDVIRTTAASAWRAARSWGGPRAANQKRTLVPMTAPSVWSVLRQYGGSAGSSVWVAPIRAAAESRPRLIGTTAVAAANP
jgi:hypothetical protein